MNLSHHFSLVPVKIPDFWDLKTRNPCECLVSPNIGINVSLFSLSIPAFQLSRGSKNSARPHQENGPTAITIRGRR